VSERRRATSLPPPPPEPSVDVRAGTSGLRAGPEESDAPAHRSAPVPTEPSALPAREPDVLPTRVAPVRLATRGMAPPPEPPAPPTDPMLGQVVGEYRLEALLGKGGFARVYRARHLVIGAETAIKILTDDLRESPSAHRRFAREIAALKTLRHDNLVSIVDSGFTTDERPYIAMDLVDGPTLREVVMRRRFSVPEAADLTRQLALGLTEVHARGFVHRDLKPKNVMLLLRGARLQLKILDFGLALITDPASEHTRLTFAGHRLGTARWMAPEQIVDPATVGPAADLYCLGLLTYTMIMGEPPFLGKAEEVLRQHLERPAPIPPALGPLAPLVRALLSKSPAERPQSAWEVLERLDALRLPAPSFGDGTLGDPTTIEPPLEATRPVLTRTVGSLAELPALEVETAQSSSASIGLGVDARAPESLTRTNRLLLALVVLLTIVAVLLAVLLVRGGGGEPRAPTVRPISR
jgi:serine/threonine protein kinase